MDSELRRSYQQWNVLCGGVRAYNVVSAASLLAGPGAPGGVEEENGRPRRNLLDQALTVGMNCVGAMEPL
jgi:hypothetical protein